MPLMPLNTHRKFTVSQNRQTRSRVCSPLLSPLLPAVVAELDDVVLVAVPLRVHYEAEKSLLLLLPVDHHPPPEEPVTTVLTGKDKESLAAYKYQKTHNTQSSPANLFTADDPTYWTGPGQNIPHWWGSFQSSGTSMCSSPDPRSQRPSLHQPQKCIHKVSQY